MKQESKKIQFKNKSFERDYLRLCNNYYRNIDDIESEFIYELEVLAEKHELEIFSNKAINEQREINAKCHGCNWKLMASNNAFAYEGIVDALIGYEENDCENIQDQKQVA